MLDVVVVGAGFAGLYMLHRLRQSGHTAKVLERGDGVGGTWYWNRYPGARCDVESLSYSYSFSDELQQEWVWPHRYAMQPDILRYINHVADRFDLRRDIVFGQSVVSAGYDKARCIWTTRSAEGAVYESRYVIMATGCLSVPKAPELPQLDQFKGRVLYTAHWPMDGYDFQGKSVAVIGTGASGIQAIPLIAAQAAHLTVFQRTANYSVPAWNMPMTADDAAAMKAMYPELRRRARNSAAGDYTDGDAVNVMDLAPDELERRFEERWRLGGFNYQYAFADLMTSEEANERAAAFVRDKIRAVVRDPKVAEALCPKDHPFGAKRLCVDTEYYETFNRPNVTLVDIKADPVIAMTADGLRTSSKAYHFDTLVLATGFDAMTGALSRIDITGRGGVTLKDRWADGPVTYLGLAVSGFPNLFVVTGPGSPSVFANMVLACEQHVEWIGDLIDHAAANGIRAVEPDSASERAWTDHVSASAESTLYTKAESWYLGANIPGKPRQFMPYIGGFAAYARVCDDVAKKGYIGFQFSKGHWTADEGAAA